MSPGTVRLLGLLAPYRAAFVLSLTLATLASILDGFTFALLIPFLRVLFAQGGSSEAEETLVERLVDGTVGGFVDVAEPEVAVRNIVLLILGLVLLKNLAFYAASYATARIEEGVALRFRQAVFHHLLRLDLEYFRRARGGALMAHAFSDVEDARTFVGESLREAVRNGVLVVVYVGLLLGMSWRLGLVPLLLAPATAILLRPLLSGIRTRARSAALERASLAARFQEAVSGMRIVKTYNAEAMERTGFDQNAQRQAQARLASQRLALLAQPASETVGSFAFAIILWFGASSTLTGEGLRPEVFMAFVAVTLRLLSPMKKLAQFPALASHAVVAADRAFEVLNAGHEEEEDAQLRNLSAFEGQLEFRDVTCRYADGTTALRGVNLTVARGETVAIVGPSGAGKSTLLDLLPRFLDPSGGEVLIDGVPTTAFRRSSLRSALAIVSQETVLFHDTVAANIAFGAPDPDRTRVVEAARAAHADDFIARLPHGYDTVIGERGDLLSGGQRQRIAIARALYRDAPILILDEATSSLDVDADRAVASAIQQLMRGRTVLVAAHRVSTVAGADRVVVLAGGEVVDVGTHQQLLEREGWYRRLHRADVAAGTLT